MSENFTPQAFFDDLITICEKHKVSWIGSLTDVQMLINGANKFSFQYNYEDGQSEVEFVRQLAERVYKRTTA